MQTRFSLFLQALLVGIVASACPGGALAQTVGLEEVVMSAGTSAPGVRREDESVRRAEGQAQQARGAFDWTLSGESGWERLYVPGTQNGFLTNDTATVDTWRTTLGATRLFRNGIAIQPGMTFFYGTDATVGQTLGLTRSRPALNVTIPLMRGFGSDNLSASNEKAAIAALEGSRYSRDFAGQRAVAEAVIIYWRCVAARDQLAISEVDRRLADENLVIVRNALAAGQTDQTMLDRSSASQATTQVIYARSIASDRLCREDLAVAMGTNSEAPPAAVVGALLDPAPMSDQVMRLNEAALVQVALSRRTDLQALARFDAAQHERVAGAQDNLQPRVDIFLDPTRALVRLSQPLGRNVAEGQIADAMAAQNEARLNLQQLQGQIRRDVGEQVRNLRDAWSAATALAEAAMRLDVVVTDAERRFQAGFLTRAEYRIMQDEFAGIRRQHIDARLQFASSLAALRLATGAIGTGDGSPGSAPAALFRSLPN